MRIGILGLFLVLLGLSPVQAQQAYMHNGSTMTVTVSGKSVEISYLSPRAGLPVQSGTRLFEGGVNEYSRKIEGTAWIFHSRCNRAYSYWVVGDFENGDAQLHLVGAAPVVDPRTCLVVGHSRESANAHLLFHNDCETIVE